MTLYQMAKQLPDKYRKHLIEENVIYKAIAKADDTHFKMLVIYWENYFDASLKVDTACNICLNGLLNKFKLLEPYFVQIEKESQLLEL